ncbi:MAG: amino acid permease, partial [Betaproteobacteria bacterium]
FETKVAYTAPAFWLFFLLTGLSLIVLRRQQPATAEPFRVPLYPFTPILFCLMCAYMLYSSTNYAMSKDPGSIGAQLGIGVMLLGLPLLWFARRSARSAKREI